VSRPAPLRRPPHCWFAPRLPTITTSRSSRALTAPLDRRKTAHHHPGSVARGLRPLLEQRAKHRARVRSALGDRREPRDRVGQLGLPVRARIILASQTRMQPLEALTEQPPGLSDLPGEPILLDQGAVRGRLLEAEQIRAQLA
jgi:hypothetical protein